MAPAVAPDASRSATVRSADLGTPTPFTACAAPPRKGACTAPPRRRCSAPPASSPTTPLPRWIASFMLWKIANCSALAGTTFKALTRFPRNKPSGPSSRSTCPHTPVTVRRAPPSLPEHPTSWIMVRARSRGATAVLAMIPARPPAKSCFMGCVDGLSCSLRAGRLPSFLRCCCRASGAGPAPPAAAAVVAADNQFHVALERACASGRSATYLRKS
mmetsp:Transcript_13357/g.32077  ORF Transcript_13357/g.32077 Transcript_13357/m.32077 type:complete len:216 (-) Transcript_13357:206-853(-)